MKYVLVSEFTCET